MRRYLLVDDNRAFAENIAEILRDAGADAAVAISGAEALELAGRERFTALVTDMRMPVMGGAELVHRVRQVDPGLAAIVVTAYTGDDDLQGARDEGLLAVLPKPVPVDRLLSLLSGARRNGLVAMVEDDLALADNLTEILQHQGFTAVTASSVTETEKLGRIRPFVGLVDLRVPGGPDGEAMRRLKQRFPELPLLVMTGHPDALPPPAEHRGLLRKPFDPSIMLGVLEELHRVDRSDA
jgi:CheY-like chemotaxis protein